MVHPHSLKYLPYDEELLDTDVYEEFLESYSVDPELIINNKGSIETL